ncbi:MAG TPA: AIR synthase-related protein, partial [Methylocystis sp.]
NITVRGATPLALTDNLNFGNPERPEYMGQFVGCVQGIGEAARALDFPIVSGNVSLYNETQGAGILPTPAIGGVGLIADVSRAAQTGFAGEGDTILLIGETKGWLGQSAYAHDLCGRADGAPPPVDLAAERRNGDFVRELILSGRVSAAHDLSDGGLAVALAEMALAGDIGAEIKELPSGAPHAALFGEDQSRYLVTVSNGADAARIAQQGAAAGVPVQPIGRTGGDALILPGEAPILLTELRKAHETPLPAFMAGEDNAFSGAFPTQVS